MNIDRFGNAFAPGLPYARGHILPTTADDIAKLKVAWAHIRRRRGTLGEDSVYLLSGLERNLQLDEVDLTVMDDEIASALFTDQVTELGPSPIAGDKPDQAIVERLKAARAVVEDFRIRALISKEYTLTTEGNVYGEVLEEDYVRDTIMEAMDAEYTRNQILIHTTGNPMSVKEIAAAIDVPPPSVLNHVVRLRQKNLLTLDHIDGQTLKYKAMGGGA